MSLSEKSDRQFGNEHSVDGSPHVPLHNGNGGGCFMGKMLLRILVLTIIFLIVFDIKAN